MDTMAMARKGLAIVGHNHRHSIRWTQQKWVRVSRSFSMPADDSKGKGNSDEYSDHNADINYVRSTMKKWVQRYVVDHELCPFAKTSDYRIAVWPGKNVQEWENGVGIQPFMKNEMDKLLDATSEGTLENKKRPNTLVVFPFVKEFTQKDENSIKEFHKFYQGVVDSISGAGSQYDVFSSSCKVQFFPFHRDENWRFKTPWPAFHLIRRYDLDKARMEGQDVSMAISEKNDLTLALNTTKNKLGNMVLDLAEFPHPIRLTKAICPGQKAKLHEEGFRIVDAQAVVIDGIKKESPPIRIKKRKGNRKSKR